MIRFASSSSASLSTMRAFISVIFVAVATAYTGGPGEPMIDMILGQRFLDEVASILHDVFVSQSAALDTCCYDFTVPGTDIIGQINANFTNIRLVGIQMDEKPTFSLGESYIDFRVGMNANFTANYAVRGLVDLFTRETSGVTTVVVKEAAVFGKVVPKKNVHGGLTFAMTDVGSKLAKFHVSVHDKWWMQLFTGAINTFGRPLVKWTLSKVFAHSVPPLIDGILAEKMNHKINLPAGNKIFIQTKVVNEPIVSKNKIKVSLDVRHVLLPVS